jgi:hypothetical protein
MLPILVRKICQEMRHKRSYAAVPAQIQDLELKGIELEPTSSIPCYAEQILTFAAFLIFISTCYESCYRGRKRLISGVDEAAEKSPERLE